MAPREPSCAAEELRGELLEGGWRQGSILPPSLGERVEMLSFMDRPQGEHVWAVVSQDCDVVSGDPDKEPAVEVIALEYIERCDPKRTALAHPRELHFDVPRPFSVNIWNRGWVKREYLRGQTPAAEPQLSETSVSELAGFCGRRYDRAALPEEFMNRWATVRDKVRKVLKRHEGNVAQLLVKLVPDGEAAKDGVYATALYVLLSDELADDSKQRPGAEKALRRELNEVLRQCEGIEFTPVVLPRDYVSLRDLDELYPLSD